MRPASIVIPTRNREQYLEVALASIGPQASQLGVDLLVVEDDQQSSELKTLAEKHGARYLALGQPRGPNTARNAGIEATDGDLVVFVDDDIEAKAGWLAALLKTTDSLPQYGVFGGPIEPRIESRTLTLCGREGPPVTFLDLGKTDCDAEFVWGANMAIRRSAFEQVGPFDESIDFCGGDEEEWERRYKNAGGKIRYIAAARVYHRRVGRDAQLRGLARSAYRRGQNAYRYDLLKGNHPRLSQELRILAGCLSHTIRYRCTNGLVLAAHEVGRLRQAARRGR